MNRIGSKMMMALAAGLLCASLASAQTLTIVSGNGQVVCPNCSQNANFFYQPFVVMATDVNGNPVSGVTVNWTIASGSGFLTGGGSTYSSTTGSNGQATAQYQLTSTPYGNSLLSDSQVSITAATSSSSTSFTLTQGLQDPINSSEQPVSASALSGLATGLIFNGQTGTTGTTPIRIGVFSEGGVGIPNVAVFLVDAESNGATVQCSPSPASTSTANPGGLNTVLTDSTGVANCYPTYSGAPGTGLFWVDVGGAQSSTPSQPASTYFSFPASPYLPSTGTGGGYTFNVGPGTPGSIVSVSGGGQSANPGQALSLPLVAQVLNSSGQPLSGITVNWTVSPSGAGVLSATTTTGTTGQTSNTIVLSSSATGTITVTASPSGSTSKATFTITAVPVVTITSFLIVSGNNQSAVVGTPFAQPLVVQVYSSSGLASGVTVQFQVESGSVSLSSNSAVTNTNGQAQVNVQAGSVAGSASVLASLISASGSSSQTFSLNVLPQGPTITASNFYNGADLQPNSLSPCGLGALIPNSSLGVANVSPTFPGLPAPQLSVAITFNSINAPILNIGNTALGQQFVLFQVPCTVSPSSSVPATVNIGGATSNVNLNVQAAAPGIFQEVDTDGVARAVIVRPDGSIATPTNPARAGETEVAYVTGLGATSPAVGTTALPVPGGAPATVLGTVVPGMNGGGVPLISAQLSPDLPGIYQVTFQIPASEPTGDVSFSIGVIPQGAASAYYSALTKVPVHQ